MIFHYIRRFWEISWLEKRLFIFGFLPSTFLIPFLKLIPLKFYWFYIIRHNDNIYEETVLEHHYIRILKKTIKRIERITPVKLTCLDKSLIFKILSDSLHLNYQISLAAIKIDDGSMIAHAYIKRGKKIVYLANEHFNNVASLTL